MEYMYFLIVDHEINEKSDDLKYLYFVFLCISCFVFYSMVQVAYHSFYHSEGIGTQGCVIPVGYPHFPSIPVQQLEHDQAGVRRGQAIEHTQGVEYIGDGGVMARVHQHFSFR